MEASRYFRWSVYTFVLRAWKLTWDLGHAGHETADYAAYALPDIIQHKLGSLLDGGNEPSPSAIGDALEQAISDFDKSIGDALLELFPDKLALMDMPDDDVKIIINENEHNAATVLRCMRGATALVSITDPSKSNLWVASLGDSAAGRKLNVS